MARRSNKSVQEILGQQQSQPTGEFITLVGVSYDDKELDRKITLVTEGFTTTKYRELILRDRTRLSKKNTMRLVIGSLHKRVEQVKQQLAVLDAFTAQKQQTITTLINLQLAGFSERYQ